MVIKGINKQIIEIKCTNNEYFDKVLLFVKSNASAMQNNMLAQKGNEFVNDFTNSLENADYSRKYRKRDKGKTLATISCIVAAAMLVLMFFVIL